MTLRISGNYPFPESINFMIDDFTLVKPSKKIEKMFKDRIWEPDTSDDFRYSDERDNIESFKTPYKKLIMLYFCNRCYCPLFMIFCHKQNAFIRIECNHNCED